MDTITPTKTCPTCGSTFSKPYTCSRRAWQARTFCSLKCKRHTDEAKALIKERRKGQDMTTQIQKMREVNIAKGHGMCGTPTYTSWQQMKARCYQRSNPRWDKYGGAGITVCDRWRDSFKNFLADMGERPEGTSLGRYGDTGNYEPGNCAWMTPTEQGLEQRKKNGFA